MSTKYLYIIRFAVGLITVALLLINAYAPLRETALHPHISTLITPFGDAHHAGGNSTAYWLDRSLFRAGCTIRDGSEHRSCGINFKLLRTLSQAIKEDATYFPHKTKNLEAITHIRLHIDYEGPSNRLFFSMRNATEGIDPNDIPNAQKYMYVPIIKNEVGEPILIKLSEFNVPEWWKRMFNIGRQDAVTEFDQIYEMSIIVPSGASRGDYTFQLREITALGPILPPALINQIIIGLWLLVIVLEALVRLRNLHLERKSFQRRLKQLQNRNQDLHVTAMTDHLTQLYNRYGAQQFINKLWPQHHKKLVVLLLDIDHFKHINDRYGHEAGDRMLQVIAQTLKEHLRHRDILARWGGEEFLLISEQESETSALTLASHICEAVAAVRTDLRDSANLSACDQLSEQASNLEVTLSIGCALGSKHTAFNDAFKSADIALYQAKSEGRNCVRLH